MNSIKLYNRIDTIFTSFEIVKYFNLSDKINLKRSDKHVASSNLSIYYTWTNIKKSCKNNTFKMLKIHA